MSLSSLFRNGPLRFGVWVAFIIVAAALARLAHLSTGWTIGVIAIAWLLVAAMERSAYLAAAASREATTDATPGVGPAAPDAAAGAAAIDAVAARSAAAEPGAVPLDAAVPAQPAVFLPAPPAPRPPRRAESEEVWLDADEADEPRVAPSGPPEPVQAAAAPTRPEAPPVAPGVPVAPAEPSSAAPAAEPVPMPAAEPVRTRERTRAGPRGQWNLWELEGIARDASGRDPARDEERSLILMYLREFATAEGALGREFDDLVRESFGDLLPQR